MIVEQDKIIVQDNANGIDATTIESILDYTIRVSSREAYVSPTRGAQGNALKTILAMGYVLQGAAGDAAGVTIIETSGVAHRIEFRADHVNNQPKIIHTTAPSPISTGTRFTIHWPAPDLLEEDRFTQLVRAYVWFNPHLTVRGVWFGREFINVAATNPNWKKWRPRNPTSAHWYDEQRLQRYLAAHVARDRDLGQSRTVREFIANFAGSPGPRASARSSTKSAARISRWRASSASTRSTAPALPCCWKRCSGTASRSPLSILASSAPGTSKSGSPPRAALSTPSSINAAKAIADDGIPYVVEFCFGLHQAGLDGGRRVNRELVTGANWSAAITNPFRRFGNTGEGLESALAKVRATANQPVICAAHLASAHIQFADRGKSSIILTDDAEQPDD